MLLAMLYPLESMSMARPSAQPLRGERPMATRARANTSMYASGPGNNYRERRWEFRAGFEPPDSRPAWELLPGGIPATEGEGGLGIRAHTIPSTGLCHLLFADLRQYGSRQGVSRECKFRQGMVSPTITGQRGLEGLTPDPASPYTGDQYPCQVLTNQARTVSPDCSPVCDGVPPTQMLAAQSTSELSRSRPRGGLQE